MNQLVASGLALAFPPVLIFVVGLAVADHPDDAKVMALLFLAMLPIGLLMILLGVVWGRLRGLFADRRNATAATRIATPASEEATMVASTPLKSLDVVAPPGFQLILTGLALALPPAVIIPVVLLLVPFSHEQDAKIVIASLVCAPIGLLMIVTGVIRGRVRGVTGTRPSAPDTGCAGAAIQEPAIVDKAPAETLLSPDAPRGRALLVVLCLAVVLALAVFFDRRIGSQEIEDAQKTTSEPRIEAESEQRRATGGDVADASRARKSAMPNPAAYFQKRELAIPVESVFEPKEVDTGPASEALLGHEAVSRARALLAEHVCASSRWTIYSLADRREHLIVSDCHRESVPPAEGRAAVLDTDFPVMLVVARDAVEEIGDLSEFGFPDEAGRLVAVTDLDRNGHLELWLQGKPSECPPETPDCTALTVLEAGEGELRVYVP